MNTVMTFTISSWSSGSPGSAPIATRDQSADLLGWEYQPLDLNELDGLIDRLVEEGIEAIAVAFSPQLPESDS